MVEGLLRGMMAVEPAWEEEDSMSWGWGPAGGQQVLEELEVSQHHPGAASKPLIAVERAWPVQGVRPQAKHVSDSNDV